MRADKIRRLLEKPMHRHCDVKCRTQRSRKQYRKNLRWLRAQRRTAFAGWPGMNEANKKHLDPANAICDASDDQRHRLFIKGLHNSTGDVAACEDCGSEWYFDGTHGTADAMTFKDAME